MSESSSVNTGVATPSISTLLTNKINYVFSNFINDPEANAHAEARAAQAEQDAGAKTRLDTANAEANAAAAAAAQAKQDSEDLNERSEFKPNRAVSDIVSGILNVLFYLLLFTAMICAGYLASNEAIGYSISFRIFSFFYGALCFWWVIPKALIQKYYNKIDIPYYGILPLFKYTPDGNQLFNYLFSYKDNSIVAAKKNEVAALYKSGYLKSIGNFQEAASLMAAATAAVVAAKVAAGKKIGPAIQNPQSPRGPPGVQVYQIPPAPPGQVQVYQIPPVFQRQSGVHPPQVVAAAVVPTSPSPVPTTATALPIASPQQASSQSPIRVNSKGRRLTPTPDEVKAHLKMPASGQGRNYADTIAEQNATQALVEQYRTIDEREDRMRNPGLGIAKLLSGKTPEINLRKQIVNPPETPKLQAQPSGTGV